MLAARGDIERIDLPEQAQSGRWDGTGGNSVSAVVAFAKRPRAWAGMARRRSGDAASPHFVDQIGRYASGQPRRIYFEPAGLAGHTERRYHPGEQGRGLGMDEGMGTRAAFHRYTRVAIALHWAIAALILYNLASGLLGAYLPGWFFAFHISSGLTILLLSVVRVVWRLTHKPPPFLPMKPWEATLAHGVHFLLYAAMLLMPFSGWALISANPPAGSPGAAQAQAERTAKAAAEGKPAPTPRKPTMFWNVVRVPLIGPVNDIGRTPEGLAEQRELHERIETLHGLGGWIMLVLLLLHVGGALKHQFVDREPELGRMGIGERPEEGLA